MTTEQPLPPTHSDAPHEQTSLRWDWLDGVAARFDEAPHQVIKKLGANTAALLGLVGLILGAFLTYHLLIQPLHQLPFGSPYAHSPRTAAAYVPGSGLSKLGTRQRAGWPRYIAAYVFTYYLPYFFSTKLKQPDLLMLAGRGLLFGLLILFSLRLYFAPPPTEESNTPS